MSFCPRCGAPTTAAQAFCTACGASLAPATYVLKVVARGPTGQVEHHAPFRIVP